MIFLFSGLAGYGFANVSKEMKASWANIIETYLYSRKENFLKMVVLLVDIRHSPSKDDIMMYQWLKGFGLNTIIIANKADKISRGQINPRINDIRKVLQLDGAEKVIPFSTANRLGLEKVWAEFDIALNVTGEEQKV